MYSLLALKVTVAAALPVLGFARAQTSNWQLPPAATPPTIVPSLVKFWPSRATPETCDVVVGDDHDWNATHTNASRLLPLVVNAVVETVEPEELLVLPWEM